MASGPQPKRVTCPKCGAPEGVPCRDPTDHRPVPPHLGRKQLAHKWYVTTSPDGLTPKRRDEMVEALREKLDRRAFIGSSMEKITGSANPEEEFERIIKAQPASA